MSETNEILEETTSETEEVKSEETEQEESETGITQSDLKYYRKNSFSKGLFVGVLIGALVAILDVIVIPDVVNKYKKDVTGDTGIITAEVEEKIENLALEIKAGFYEDVTDEQLVDGIYRGMFESLDDPYSIYYTSKEYETAMLNVSAEYSGIGAVLSQDKETKVVTITKIYEGSPADKFGLHIEDIIVSANGVLATDYEVSEFVENIRGKRGTIVDLHIKRGDEELDFKVVRENVSIPTVETKMFDDGIGMITIQEFGTSTAEDFVKAVEALEEQGMTKLIIDIRSNGGGILTSATDLLDYILPEGVVTWVEDKYGNKKEYYSGKSCIDYPMVVLVNENTASASEIFAGAMRDYGYATIVGKKTFGKGIVQTIKHYKDDSGYKITTAKYFTPSGENIHKVGIEPDVEVDFEYKDIENYNGIYDYMCDSQFVKAYEILKDK